MEEVFKNRIITISGEPASGKGTTVRALKEKFQQEGYNVYVISVGDMFREVSVEEFKKEHPEIENPTIEQVNNDKEFTQKRAEIDRNIDSYIAKKGLEINSIHRPNDVYIIDSRLAFSNVPDSFAIRLTVDPNIAGRRVFGDDSRGTEDEYESIEEATESTRKRTRGEVERYKERYGVDLTDKNNYDLVIDTSYSTTEDILNVIYMCEEEKRKGSSFSKTWTSPKKLLPLQTIRETGGKGAMGKDIEGFREMLKEKGYDVKEAIEVLSVDGVDYILEGHHRNFAAALNHMTLVPYKIVAKDDEKMPGAINTARQYAYAYIEDQREYLSRYVYDHEEFFRKIKDEKGQEIEPNFTYAEVYGGKYPSIPKKSREDDGQER